MMHATLSIRSLLLSSVLLGGAAALATGVLSPAPADAQNKPAGGEPTAGSAQGGAPLMVCTVAGEPIGKPDTKLFDSRTGGKPIAKLTGASVPMKVAHVVPPGGGRVKVTTGSKSGYLRIEGWADVDAFRFYAGRDLPIVGSGGHVAIARGQTLKIEHVKSDKMTAAHRVLGSSHQKVKATFSCPDASLTFPTLRADDVPERARTYQMRRDRLELLNGPRGEVIFTLELDEGTRTVFWSNERRGGYIRVHSRSDLVIDAWVRAYEVVPLRHAEVFDPTMAGPRPPRARKLALQDPPKLLKALSEMTIYRYPRDAAPTLGVVEKGARFYPMEQSGDWTNVMPHNLGVLPADSLGFWVRTAELPKGG